MALANPSSPGIECQYLSFSLAGIPPLAGFMGKYMIFTQAMSAGFTWLTILAVIFSLVGVYYYFKIVICDVYAAHCKCIHHFDQKVDVECPCSLLLLLILGIFPDILFHL